MLLHQGFQMVVMTKPCGQIHQPSLGSSPSYQQTPLSLRLHSKTEAVVRVHMSYFKSSRKKQNLSNICNSKFLALFCFLLQ